MSRQRSGPLLRPSPTVIAWAAPLLVLVTLVGALVVVLDAAAVRQGREISARMAGGVTVAVWDRGLESADAAQARASEILSAMSGAVRVTQLDPVKDDRLIAQAMGIAGPAAADARLLKVTGQVAGARIAQSLRAQGVMARIDDRAWPRSPTWRTETLAMIGGVSLPLAMVLGVAGICAAGVRREAAQARPALELMRLFGATDRFVADQFRGRWTGGAFACAAIGAVAVVIVGFAWGPDGALAALPSIQAMDFLWLAPWLVVTGLVGFLASGRAGGAAP